MLRIGFCIHCKAGISPVVLALFVFALPRSLLLFIPSPTSSKYSPGLVLESIPGVSMGNLKPGFDISEQEAERISSDMMAGLRAIKAENYWDVVLREGTGLPPPLTLERPTSGSLELAMKIREGLSAEVRICVT